MEWTFVANYVVEYDSSGVHLARNRKLIPLVSIEEHSKKTRSATSYVQNEVCRIHYVENLGS